MGIIKAAISSVGGSLADQWLEVIEPTNMKEGIVFSKGQLVRKDDKRGANKKFTVDTISNGSIIHVYENQCMLLVDGGKIVDYTAEPGMYKVDNSSLPSLFNGKLSEAVKDTFNRFKYGGVTPTKQQVFYINTQEIKGIKFGTKNPINYFDSFYNAELFLRTFGTYSIKIVDPIKFYKEAISKSENYIHIDDINEQYMNEFLEGLSVAINRLSADGERISFVTSKGTELSSHMSQVLDDKWNDLRGMEILSVGLASISYDDESKELINMRNKGAMLSDANVREGYVQGSIARGIEAAGSNEKGSAATFMGMGMGMNAAGGFMGQASQTNREQMNKDKDMNSWTCSCGNNNTGKFCSECGKEKTKGSFCTNCGNKIEGEVKFCSNCGQKQ